MKVVCIDNTKGNANLLELYKSYNTLEKTEWHLGFPKHQDYFIIDFKDHEKGEIWVKKFYFISLDEWRQKQIDKVL